MVGWTLGAAVPFPGVDVRQRCGMPVVAGSASGHDGQRHSLQSTG